MGIFVAMPVKLLLMLACVRPYCENGMPFGAKAVSGKRKEQHSPNTSR